MPPSEAATEYPVAAVGAGATEDTANTVPVSWVRLGLLLAFRVTDPHGGGPAVNVAAGVTACQAPAPLLAALLNHSKLLPPPKSQSVIVTVENAFPVDRATSKYFPVVVKVAVRAGLDPYCATVSAPWPEPLAVVPELVAVAVPPEVSDLPLAELVAPAGAAGGVGGEVSAIVVDAVIALPPMVPVIVDVPVVTGEVNVAV